VGVNQYALSMGDDVERQLGRCRASLRQSIRKKLQEIVEAAGARPSPRAKRSPPAGPPLRLYVFEGYRVSYEVNPVTRTVTVLELRAESS
jgi:mRNA-degrading endonuclease RelE of RelBE toxin-antitoxin system